jgi:hypothetical protein
MQKLLIILGLNFTTCSSAQQKNNQITDSLFIVINKEGRQVQDRFLTPKGYTRTNESETSYAQYLRHLPLHKDGSKVHLYNGEIKNKENVYCAVIALDIGNQDLQQCADAVMRLRGEYLFAQQEWDKLGFEFTQDHQLHYFYKESNQISYPYFRSWMNNVFAYANTRSLHHQLKTKKLNDIAIGDVFIQTGNPYGHAVTVVDIAINPANGDKIFMLAQSYMPAQEIQILLNPNKKEKTPWYSISEIDEIINTPEWTFTVNDLKSW